MMGAGQGGAIRNPYGGAETYVDVMFNLGGAAPAQNTLTSMNPGVATSGTNYQPQADGTLISIQIQLTPQAATSNAQSGYVALTCKQWAPINVQNIAFSGFGLATAPQVYGGLFALSPWIDVFLPVRTSVPVTGQVSYTYPATPVTPNIYVIGKFVAANTTAAR